MLRWSEELSTYLESLEREGSFSGVVLIGSGSEVLFQAAYGLANRSWGIANTVATRFATASVTKMFTSVAFLQLVESGAADLHTSVAEVLGLASPALPEEVTFYHLLTHTSGIGDYLDESTSTTDELSEVWSSVPNYSMRSLSDFLPLVLAKPPNSPPGPYAYCNSGYILLGMAIERLSGLPYFDYVREHVLYPAEMHDSGFFAMDEVVQELAEGYVPLRDCSGRIMGMRRNAYAVTAPASDGGLVTSADDIRRFLSALRHARLLSEEMTGQLLTPKVSMTGSSDSIGWYGYGMGFLVQPERGRHVLRFGHRGEDPGVSAAVAHHPDHGLDVVLLGNQTGCVSEPYARIHEMVVSGRVKIL